MMRKLLSLNEYKEHFRTSIIPLFYIVANRPIARQRPRNKQRVQTLLCVRQINRPPFLSSGSVNTFPQKGDAHNNIVTMGTGGVFYVVRVEELKRRQLGQSSYPRVEAGSNTSTVTLRVVGGKEKGSLKCETVKYGHESQGTRTQERLCWQGPVAIANDIPVLSSERAPHINKPATVRQ
jgi:hypothetical protein